MKSRQFHYHLLDYDLPKKIITTMPRLLSPFFGTRQGPLHKAVPYQLWRDRASLQDTASVSLDRCNSLKCFLQFGNERSHLFQDWWDLQPKFVSWQRLWCFHLPPLPDRYWHQNIYFCKCAISPSIIIACNVCPGDATKKVQEEQELDI
jgi:hypothetical protein